jgi:hypothetical protein
MNRFDGRNQVPDFNLLLLGLWLSIFGGLHINNSLHLRGGIDWCTYRHSLGSRRLAGWLITHSGKGDAILVLTQSGDADAADWGLELDQRMRAIVPIGRDCLTVGTEVSVVANGALEAHSLDVGQIFLVFAERTITVDAIMAHSSVVGLGERLVDGNEPMAGMDELGILDALRAEIPVGAVEALVANAVDELLASIAHGRVTNMSAGVAEIAG